MTWLRRVVLAVIAIGVALVLVGLGFVWVEPDAVLRRLDFSAASERLVTGILVTGTPGRPVVYVTSSDPRIGEGLFDADDSVDTNSGVLSRLVLTRRGWEKTDLVRGLPRSNLDHASNGMAFSADGSTLYIAQGGNTNQGAPSTFFNAVPEYALSGAMLAVDLVRLGDRAYDLPTLDDPDRPGRRDEHDPFGGNKGRNQARLIRGGPVQVYASGFRNPYDVVVTERGSMYTFQNGPDPDIGGLPVGEGPAARCTNELRDGGRRGADTLHLVEHGGYYGHPNPSRAECDYVPARKRGALLLSRSSTNGIAEYLASNLGGRLRGNLIVVSLRGEVSRLALSQDGTQVRRSEVLTRLAAPLDVTTQGDEDLFPGTIWVAQYAGEYGGAAAAGSPIAVLEPSDYGPRGWSVLPASGDRRQEVSFVEAGGKLYLAGGTTRHQVYDPETRRWSDLEPLPERLDHIQGVRVGKRIFYIGGLDRLGEQASSVYVYDPVTDGFSRGAPMPRARGAGGVVAHGGKIYYAGGLHDGRAVPWLDVYDPARDSVVPAARHASAAGPLPGRRRRRDVVRDRRAPGPLRQRACRERCVRLRDWSVARRPRPHPHATWRLRGCRSWAHYLHHRRRDVPRPHSAPSRRTTRARTPGGRSIRCRPRVTAFRPQSAAAGSSWRRVARSRPPARPPTHSRFSRRQVFLRVGCRPRTTLPSGTTLPGP